MAYLEGNIARFTVTFTTESTGDPVDPTVVKFSYAMNYGSTINTWTWNGSNTTPSVGNIAKISTGVYEVWVDTTGLNGLLIGDWLATGVGASHVQDPVPVGNTTGNGMLFSNLIEIVFRRVVGPVTQRIVSVNNGGPIGSNDESFVFEGAQSTGMRPGQKISIDLEDMLILGASDQTATVYRGYGGSQQATHADGSLVYINARVTRNDVAQAINDDLNDLSSQGLFRVGVAQLTWNPVFYGYDLGGVPTNYIDILGVESRTIDPSRRFPASVNFDVRRWNQQVTDSAFPSGNAIILYEQGDPGQPIYVTYSAPFLPLVNPTDGVTNTPAVNDQAPPPNGYAAATVPNLALTMLDIPPLGATAALIQPGEISRNDIGPMPDSAKAVDVPATAIANATNPLLIRRAQRVSAEADRLYVAYPDRR